MTKKCFSEHCDVTVRLTFGYNNIVVTLSFYPVRHLCVILLKLAYDFLAKKTLDLDL